VIVEFDMPSFEDRSPAHVEYLADRYEAVVLITAPAGVRNARRPEHFEQRAATQLPEAEKAAQADYVYVNDGTPAELERWVADLVARLRAA